MRLGRYELLHRVARGGMAEVWAARQLGELGFSRIVAVKMILPELEQDVAFRRMFLEEARLASGIRHANVVEVLDLGEAGPLVYQAMPLLDGDSLSGLLQRWQRSGREGPVPEGIVVRVICDALAGLHAAHELTDEQGHPLHVIHRDVSPQNILVGLDGVARIADFGVAKALGRLAEETEAGQIKGKYGYLAPELVERKPADRRSDVFSAGVVLWEALTGTRLFKGQDPIETLERVRTLKVPDPRTVRPSVSAVAAEATMRALARRPEDRFATAASMAEALDEAARSIGTKDVSAFVRELVAATPRSSEEDATIRVEDGETLVLPKRAARSRTWIWVGATVLVVIAATIGASRVRAHGAPAAPPSPAPSSAPPPATALAPEPSPTVVPGAPSLPSVAPARTATTPRRAAPAPRPKFGNPYDR
jgi:serine/threonine-protein kinase